MTIRFRTLPPIGMLLTLVAGIACWAGTAEKAVPPGHAPTAAELKFFEAKIRPLLVENCFKCHGEDKQEENSAARFAGRGSGRRRPGAGDRAGQAGGKPAHQGGQAPRRLGDAPEEEAAAARADCRLGAVDQVGGGLARRWQARRRAGKAGYKITAKRSRALGLSAGQAAADSRGEGQSVGRQSDRRLHSGQARSQAGSSRIRPRASAS